MKKHRIFLVFALPIIIFLIGFIIYSFNINQAVSINIDNIIVDGEYLENSYIDYNTNGKKVVSCNINLKNNSFFKIKYIDISNAAFDSILTGDRIEDPQMIELSMFDSKIIPCYILVDENMELNDIKQLMETSEIKILKYLGNNASYCDLSVDKVIFE